MSKRIRYNRIKHIFSLIALWGICWAYGQQEPHDFDYLEKIVPPSPTAASLGTYGNIPINLSNGSPNINLPIYTLLSNDVSIPINISYSSNGVQVDGVPGQLGVDWGLQVGGAVTRTLYDEDDLGTANFHYLEGGYCNTGESEGVILSSTGTDTQKDIFNYNAMGVISGTFVLNENKQPQQLEYSDNKIEFVLYPDPNGSVIKGFKITDTSGTQYFLEKIMLMKLLI